MYKNKLTENMKVSTIIYCILPTVFYLAFGSKTEEFILFNLPMNNWFFLLVQILYMIMLCFSYPLQLYPVLVLGDDFAKYLSNSENSNNKKYTRFLKIFIRILIVLLICGVAFSLKDIANFLSLVGSMSSTVVGFVLPVIMYEIYFKDKLNKNIFSTFLNYFFMIVGITGGCFGVYFSIKKLINPRK